MSWRVKHKVTLNGLTNPAHYCTVPSHWESKKEGFGAGSVVVCTGCGREWVYTNSMDGPSWQVRLGTPK